MSLDEKILNEFKELLLASRQKLLALQVIGHDACKTVKLDQSRMGRLSRMDALQGQAMSLEVRRRREIELQKITAALQRLEERDYGFCVHCDEGIALKRLEFDPATPLCIQCASAK